MAGAIGPYAMLPSPLLSVPVAPLAHSHRADGDFLAVARTFVGRCRHSLPFFCYLCP